MVSMKINEFQPKVVLIPTVEGYKAAREKLGSQEYVSEVLDYGGQSIVSLIETGQMYLCPRAYTLLLLLANDHPTYKLKPKKEAKSVMDLVVNIDEEKKSSSYHILSIKEVAKADAKDIAHVLRCSVNTILGYENGTGSPSKRLLAMMLLIFKIHPYFELVKK